MDRRGVRMAMAGFICGIASFVGYVFTAFLAVVAIVLGIMARRHIDGSGQPEGRKLATAAIWLGIVDLALVAAIAGYWAIRGS